MIVVIRYLPGICRHLDRLQPSFEASKYATVEHYAKMALDAGVLTLTGAGLSVQQLASAALTGPLVLTCQLTISYSIVDFDFNAWQWSLVR